MLVMCDNCGHAIHVKNEDYEQEPCDAVSRGAVCDYIAEFVNNEFSTQAECEMVDAMIEGIQHLPSVTQKLGKWIKSRDSYGNNHFTCPFCDHDIATRNADNWDDNYCSNCGARMRGAE